MIDYDPHHFTRHILAIRGSMLREILARVISCTLFSVIVTYVHLRVRPFSMPDKPHVFIGVALGLLLVFRTNASYDRYWEGRRLWGTIVNETRSLARRAAVHLGADVATMNRLVGWLIAFPYATMNHLRGEKGIERAAELLDKDDVKKALVAHSTPVATIKEASNIFAEALRKGKISDVTHVALEDGLSALISCLGGCERIVKTPLPFPYVVHLRRALVIYCFTLPLAFVESFRWWTIAATFFLAYILFGIEEIGVEIENPFEKEENDLPLARICENIDANLRPFLSNSDASNGTTK